MTTDTTIADVRLVRTCQTYLRIIGATCQIQHDWEIAPCGGELLVEDWRGRVSQRWMNYELFCVRCGTCDPDGWQTQDEVITAARNLGK